MTSKIPYYQLEVQNVLQNLTTSEEWLSDQEVALRHNIYGFNILKELKHETIFHKIMKQFKDALIILLIVSAWISVYLQDYRGASILWAIVLLNACIGYFQEAKAEKIMQSLKKMLHPSAKVKRDGKLIEEQASKLVPWDIVYVEEGDSIPADLRVIQEMNLQTNDFSLTWESSPINKYIHAIAGDVNVWQRNNMLFMGTTVATWSGYGIVIATWMNTELWRIAAMSHEAVPENTPLQNELQNIAKKLVIWSIILWGLLLVVALLSNFTLKEAFLFAVGIAAAMVPQGLPAQVSAALTLASWRLAKNKALIKQLSSVETLGCVNIICTDKTWTLTKNEMTVKKIYLWGMIYDVTETGYMPNGMVQRWRNEFVTWEKHLSNEEHVQVWKHFFYWCVLNSHAKIHSPDEEHLLRYAIGDPTEAALINVAKKAWIDTDALDKKYPMIYEFGFDSVRKKMSNIRSVDGETIAYVKWAPREMIDKCSMIFDGKKVRPLAQKEKEHIIALVDNLASDAMRNLVLAYKVLPDGQTSFLMNEVEKDLIFVWFASIIDPPREEVPAAMEAAYRANIKVIMITGDASTTAVAIAKRIGLEKIKEQAFVVTGDQIKQKSDIQLLNDLQHRRVIFCRTSPEDKLRIVLLLKKNNNIVAVTGDGINDAPALKMANIWVAMGKIWTDVAKEASEIVLLDDSFSTLVYAINEWRIIFQNLKKTIISCITSNGGELFAILPSLLAKAIWAIPISINPAQILMIDLMAEMGPLTALTWDPPEKGLMEAKPRNVKNHVLNKVIIIDLIWSGALMGLIAFTNYILYFVFHGLSPWNINIAWISYMTANAVTYTSIVFCQYANILSRRAWEQSVFTSYLWSNKKLLFAFAICLLGMLALLYIPVLTNYFAFGPLTLLDWLFPIWGWILFLLIREGVKWKRRKTLNPI